MDSFAGVGGWARGEEDATKWSVNIAINHNDIALQTYKVNQPWTECFCESVWDVPPRKVVKGRPVAHAHFSPDCTHHSNARGKAPVSDRVRGLAWIVLKWAYQTRPRVLTMENVVEFEKWGPVGRNGRAIKSKACQTFKAFIQCLTTGIPRNCPAIAEIKATLGRSVPMSALYKGLGYKLDHRRLKACDFGSPTIRKRFFLVARSDGEAIIWPKPTHVPPDQCEATGLPPWRMAAQCIDWTRHCPSIFMTAEEAKAYYKATGVRINRPLAPKTMRRIANGVKRYVLESANPFLISVNHGDSGGRREYPIDEPLRTICGNRGGEAVVAPMFVGTGSLERHPLSQEDRQDLVAAFLTTHFGNSVGGDMRDPTNTVLPNPKQSLSQVWIVKHYGGETGTPASNPFPTITKRGTQNQIAAAQLFKFHGTAKMGQDMRDPAPTIRSKGKHLAVQAAYLINYYSSGSGLTGAPVGEPLPTVTSKLRHGVITVTLNGEQYYVADIGMRMLAPDELLAAQFGEYASNWNMLGNKTQQIAGIGNSVCPHVAAAICRANVDVRRIAPLDQTNVA